MPDPSKLSTEGWPINCHTHSHADLCPSTIIQLGRLHCMAQWDYFVRGLCFSQLCSSCYPTILQNNRKELSSRNVSLLVPQILKRDGATCDFSEMVLQCAIEQQRHGGLSRKVKAVCLESIAFRAGRRILPDSELCLEAG